MNNCSIKEIIKNAVLSLALNIAALIFLLCIGSIGLGSILSFLNKSFETKPKNQYKPPAGTREGTEAYEIYIEVEKRKEIAKQKGADQLISWLYFNDIQYYPTWTTWKDLKKNVPKIVSNVKTNLKSDKEESVSLKISGNSYKFHFKQDYEINSGLLELFNKKDKIFSFSVNDKNPRQIYAFVDGAWIKDFEQLKSERAILRENLRSKEAEAPEKIKKMKKNFGIDV